MAKQIPAVVAHECTWVIRQWTCVRWAVAHPAKWAICMGIGIVLGCAIGAASYLYLEATAPIYPRLIGDVSVWRGEAGTIWMRAHYESAAPLRCLRQDTHLLADLSAEPRPIYYQAGSGMGGRGLKGEFYSFDVLRSLPADFPAGNWTLITRLHYECEPFGLVHWEKTLPPIRVHIPPLAK